MPEGLEAEIWRTALTPMAGRRITRAWVDNRVASPGFARFVTGASVAAETGFDHQQNRGMVPRPPTLRCSRWMIDANGSGSGTITTL